MGLLDKARAAAEQAAQKAKETAELAADKTKETVDDVQAKRGLSQAYGELGRITFELHEAGEIAHEKLTPSVEKIRKLQSGDGDGGDEATAQPDAIA